MRKLTPAEFLDWAIVLGVSVCIGGICVLPVLIAIKEFLK